MPYHKYMRVHPSKIPPKNQRPIQFRNRTRRSCMLGNMQRHVRSKRSRSFIIQQICQISCTQGLRTHASYRRTMVTPNLHNHIHPLRRCLWSQILFKNQRQSPHQGVTTTMKNHHQLGRITLLQYIPQMEL